MVKLSYHSSKFVYNEMYKYAGQIGITAEGFLDIILTSKEWIEDPRSKGRRIDTTE